jgi:hypothetical protein
VSKREKVLELMAKHPKWRVSQVAKAAKCSETLVYIVRSQAREDERHAALVELDAERRASVSVASLENSAQQEHTTSVSVATVGVSAEVKRSYLETNDLPPGPVEVVTRNSILSTAKSYITRDRQADHGDAEDNFSRIAGYWSLHTGVTLTATDVAVMMALLKVARIKQNPQHVDNWVDGAGYFAKNSPTFPVC